MPRDSTAKAPKIGERFLMALVQLKQIPQSGPPKHPSEHPPQQEGVHYFQYESER